MKYELTTEKRRNRKILILVKHPADEESRERQRDWRGTGRGGAEKTPEAIKYRSMQVTFLNKLVFISFLILLNLKMLIVK